MRARTAAITETLLVVHWPDAPEPATWQALKPLIEVWIGDVNPDYPKFAGPSYYTGTNLHALEPLLAGLDQAELAWQLEVTTTVTPAPQGVVPQAWTYQIPPHEIGNTYVDGGERFVVSLVNGERPEPRIDGDQRADTPEAALRRTIEFVGSEDGWQNHWYVYDRQTSVLHQFEQGDSELVLLLGEDAASGSRTLGDMPNPNAT